jgi:hypothetical protein
MDKYVTEVLQSNISAQLVGMEMMVLYEGDKGSGGRIEPGNVMHERPGTMTLNGIKRRV